MSSNTYPLSPMQQGMLYHTLLTPNSGIDIEQVVITCEEVLDIDAFIGAWHRTAERHEILRTTFCWEGQDEPTQKVHDSWEVQWECHDWRNLSPEEQQERSQAFLFSDRLQGFDLSKSPPTRLALLCLGKAYWKIVWTFHHILLDGYSLPIILREVFAFYEASFSGRERRSQQPLPYRGYIEWLGRQDWSAAEECWRRSLQGFTAPTPLIVCRHSDIGVKARKNQEIKLNQGLTLALLDFVEQHRITVNTLMQGVWAILLSRYSGEQDVVFGATRRNRHVDCKGVSSMVGLLINTLPIRVQINPELSVIEWLQQLRAQWLAMREYEHTPLARIQEWGEVPKGVSLFESILVFEDAPLNTVMQSLGGQWEHREFELLEQPSYPLVIAAYLEFANTPGKECLRIKAFYDCARFDNATIARLLSHVKVALANIIDNPFQKVFQLPILTEAERRILLVDWNKTQADYPTDKCVHELFEEQVERTPEAIAVIADIRRLTYAEVNSRANQLARFLHLQGVKPGSIVAVCMGRSPEMIIAILSVLKAGGAYLPIDPSYPQERIDFIINDACAQFFLSDANHASSESSNNLPRLATSSSLAYVIYTSGSTGKPKGVAIEHRSVVALISWAKKVFSPEVLTGVLASTSICFDLSIFEMFVPLSQGGKVILAENALHLPQLPSAAEVTLINTVPSAIAELIRMDGIPKSVSCVNLAGEPLQNKLVQQLYSQENIQQVFNLYGPSEDTTYSTFALMEKGQSVMHIGRPISNTQVYLLDSFMQPVPIGVVGELYIGGDGLAREYLNRPELTVERFVPNPFNTGSRLYKTGDLCRYLPSGDIEFFGRIDNQVKIKGYRIELGEIEARLNQHPRVREAVVAVKDAQLFAYVVAEFVSVDELKSFLEQQLPRYMIPSGFMLLDSLPLTPNGKVDRKALPVPEPSAMSRVVADKEPETKIEQAIALVWQQVLRVEKVGVFDNFFDLGGNSISMTQVFGQLQSQFKDKISMIKLLEYPTISSLAKYLEQGDEQSLVSDKRRRYDIRLKTSKENE